MLYSFEKKNEEHRTIWDLTIKLFDESVIICMNKEAKDKELT